MEVGQGHRTLRLPPKLGPEVPNLGHLLLSVNDMGARAGKAKDHRGHIYRMASVVLAVAADMQLERVSGGLHLAHIFTDVKGPYASHGFEAACRSVTVHGLKLPCELAQI